MIKETEKIKDIKVKFENMEIKSFAREVIEFIDDSPSTYHVVKNCSVILEENGFKRLGPKDKWNLKPGGKYFIKRSNSTIIVTCDNGWSLSFRIHNASTKVENSLKFDIQLIGIPSSLYVNQQLWHD